MSRELTKEQLIAGGVTDVNVETGEIMLRGKPARLYYCPNGKYAYIRIYDVDEQGNYIKIPKVRYSVYTGKPHNAYDYKQRIVYLQQVVYAWKYDIIPEGMQVDHICNDLDKTLPINNSYDKLQLLTARQNSRKDKVCNYIPKMRAKGYDLDELTKRIEKITIEVEEAKEQKKLTKTDEAKRRYNSLASKLSHELRKLDLVNQFPERYLSKC